MKNLDYSTVASHLPESVLTHLGRVAAFWGYLETDFNLTLARLVLAAGLESDKYLRTPFNSRMALAHKASKAVHTDNQQVQFGRVLGKIANASGKRDILMHGRIEVCGDQLSIYVESHNHNSRNGEWSIKREKYSPRRLAGASTTIINAANALVDFNRQTEASLPATWLDTYWRKDRLVIRPLRSIEQMRQHQPRLPLG